MTDAVLHALLEVSAYAAALYVVLALFRRLLGAKAGPRLRLALWGLLILRLLLPVTWESPVRPFALPVATVAAQPGAAPTVHPVAATALDGVQAFAEHPVAAPQRRSSPEATTGNTQADSRPAAPSHPTLAAVPTTAVTPFRLNWQQLLLMLWLAGVLATTAVFAAQSVRLRRRLRAAADPDEHLRALLERERAALGLRRAPRLRMTEQGSPALTASLRPVLLVPRWMVARLGDRELSAALRHELTHYRRRDHWVALGLIALRCVYWFHPCVWLMARDMREDMELACDAAAVAAMDLDERRAYAATLLALYGRGAYPPLAVAMVGRARRTVERRIRSVFAPQRTAPTARLGALALAAVLALGCFTTACQPRRALPAALQQDAPAPLQAVELNNPVTPAPAAASTAPTGTTAPRPARYAGIPASWQGALTVKNLPIQVSIDADIAVPPADKLPVAVVAPTQITQQEVDGFLAAFGQAPYHLNNDGQIKTKANYANTLKDLKRSLAAVDGNTEYTAEQKVQFKKDYQQAIQRTQRDMGNAPDSVDDVIDPVFTNRYLIQQASQPEYFAGQPEDTRTNQQRTDDANALLERLGLQEIRVKWSQNDEEMSLQAWRGNDWQNNFIDYRTKRGESSTQNTVDGVDDIKYMKTTWVQARTLAQKAVDALGMDYLTLARSGKLIDYVFGYRPNEKGGLFTDFGDVVPREYGYVFDFTRSVGGVSETFATNSIRIHDYPQEPPYERLRIVIDDKGIRQLRHDGPATMLGETLSDDSELMDFQQIQAIAREQLTAGNISLGTDSIVKNPIFLKAQVWIDHVELGYARVKLSDGRYALTPAWDFFGYWAIQENDENQGPFNTYSATQDMRRWSVLTINAVDGSVIDRNRGY